MGRQYFFARWGKDGRGREDGEETGQSEGKGRERDGAETENKGMEKRKRWGGPECDKRRKGRGRGKWRRSGRDIKKCGAKAATVVAGLGPTGRESM